MPSFEYEREFKLTAQQAYDSIGRWLVSIKAKIEDHTEPYYIKAVHGSYWKWLKSPFRKKKIQINITPLEPNILGVKVHLKASIGLWRRKSRMNQAQEAWDEYLFSQLWNILNETKQEEINWQIKITQFLIILPRVEKESDFKRFMIRLCKQFKVENLPDDQILQITEALKLQLLTAKIFITSKKEKFKELVRTISKKIFGEIVPTAISVALFNLVEYLIE